MLQKPPHKHIVSSAASISGSPSTHKHVHTNTYTQTHTHKHVHTNTYTQTRTQEPKVLSEPVLNTQGWSVTLVPHDADVFFHIYNISVVKQEVGARFSWKAHSPFLLRSAWHHVDLAVFGWPSLIEHCEYNVSMCSQMTWISHVRLHVLHCSPFTLTFHFLLLQGEWVTWIKHHPSCRPTQPRVEHAGCSRTIRTHRL